jgi:hypothetical protein
MGATKAKEDLLYVDDLRVKKVVLNDVEITASAAELNKLDGVTADPAELNIMDGVTKTAAQINLLVAGVAAGYKIARGVAAITGSGTVVTGLATVVAVIATPDSDPDGVALAAVSAQIGDQAGAPAAGSVILKAWKVTATGDATLIAATAAKNINWIAIGT